MVGNTALLITGIMVGYLASALVSVLQFSGNKDANFAFILWSQAQLFPGHDRQVFSHLPGECAS